MTRLNQNAIELLNKAVARIHEFPREFTMMQWAFKSSLSPCGTVGCIAFEVCMVAGEDPSILGDNGFAVQKLAASYLKIRDPSLFYLPNWPCDLRQRYWDSNTTGRPAIVAEVVQLWIQGDGEFPSPERISI